MSADPNMTETCHHFILETMSEISLAMFILQPPLQADRS